jgi:hypothetical protein
MVKSTNIFDGGMNNLKTNEWMTLGKSPITMALFQMRFEKGDVKLNDFLVYDEQLCKLLPNRKGNMHTDIALSSNLPLGTSNITGTSNTHINSYIYSSEDEKSKLVIEEESLTYIDEHDLS